ncbi:MULTISPECIES: transketolase C-terminal domain-containing protein [unclassified Acinetobacter]|uniref:transketolase C-terminal domain-containing protein n=1 Tax=unclassified Acinetobacter TaxID=196816 RepID=UPI002934E99D|nr:MULTISPECIES: transketolase C-terminal domain-containing protein [unclassified Acinetobacter]WOE33293.1 transketolase C-terminal domain-containing protein [Acinetobacter sp. SAAs470]WOE36929.1 transketolase C-terminal domain-containing protein [Acinetobacter sp. SAAs474]
MAIQRSADALLHDIGVNQAKVVLLVDRCGVGAEDGPTHHRINDLAILRSCPKMEIYSCSNNNLLDIADRILNKERSGPIAIRIFKGPLIDCSEDTLLHWPKGLFTHRNGNDLTILSHGRILGECLKAAELLKNDTINCNVIEIIKLHPIDPSLLSFLQEKGPVIIVEEHANNGSVGTNIGAIWNSTTPIKHLYITNQLTPHGDFIWQWQQNGLDAKSIYNSCKYFLKEIKEEK